MTINKYMSESQPKNVVVVAVLVVVVFAIMIVGHKKPDFKV